MYKQIRWLQILKRVGAAHIKSFTISHKPFIREMQICHNQFYKMARINRLRIYFIPFWGENRKISISQAKRNGKKAQSILTLNIISHNGILVHFRDIKEVKGRLSLNRLYYFLIILFFFTLSKISPINS